MPLFDIPTRPGIAQDKLVAQKAKSKAKKTPTSVRGGGLISQIQNIVHKVDSTLGQYRDIYKLIMGEEELHRYLKACKDNHYISIDTETNGLNPFRNIIAGICINTYGEQGVYIPINHVNYITDVPIAGQLPSEIVIKEFEWLLESRPDIDMFNASFDIRFMRAFGVKSTYCTWDASIGARMLNENEPEGQRGLKQLHNKYCLDGKGDAFAYDDLFKKVPFTHIPLDTAYLYAAHDPVITTEYCDFQRQFLTYDPTQSADARNGMNGIAWVFQNIEMTIVDVVVDMETTGVAFDHAYNRELAEKYHKMLDESLATLQRLTEPYAAELQAYKSFHPKVKLDSPINFGSPQQLAILLYDILQLDAGVDKITKKPIRGTGEEVLSSLDHPICKAVLEYRALEKLVGTYIDKLPDCVEAIDNRIHCEFNQYGADTGRFSSSNPNLQNIPSHNKDIRKMFVARSGYVLLSSDFSQQEPKCLAALCKKQGDPQMYDTFMEGKDLYSEIASKAFNLPYEECLEHFPKGSYIKQNGDKWYYATPDDYDKVADGANDTYADGKGRRSQAKSILLGVLYGRSTGSVAEQLHCTEEEAQAIKDSVFQGFPAIKKFEQDSLNMAADVGYVTTVCGRKRRLPALQLPDYEFRWKKGFSNPYDDPLDFDTIYDNSVPDEICDRYWNRLQNARYKTRSKIFQDAEAEGIDIISNTNIIKDTKRQCVNARIQGSAADLTKLAMIDLYSSERLRELGFKLLIPVHDEVIAECPEENAKECSTLLASIMSGAAEKILEMPIKCDVVVSKAWYGAELEVE